MEKLRYCEVSLKLTKTTPGMPGKIFVPRQYFDIRVGNRKVGEIKFLIGQSKHVCMYAGHIGFAVEEKYRGNRYATKALKAILPHCFKYFSTVYITCKPENIPSIKTIESCPFKYLGISKIPKNNRMYKEGFREVRSYKMDAEDFTP